MKQFKSILVLLALISFTAVEAQEGGYFSKFRAAKKWSVGLQISPTAVHGDVSDFALGLAGGAHVKYSVSQAFGLKMSGNIGQLKGGRANPRTSGGRDASTVVPGNPTDITPSKDSYSMTNNFKDFDVSAVFTLGNLSFLRPLRKIQLFTFIGVGAIWSDATGEFSDAADAKAYYGRYKDDYVITGYDNNNVATTTTADVVRAETAYKGRNLAIPFGFGVKRNFGERFDLGLEWRTRWTRSDDLDAFNFDVSRNLARDFYSTLGIQASMKLGKKGEKSHYDWLNPLETLYADMEEMKKVTEDLKELAKDDDGDGVSNFFDKDNTNTDCDKVYPNGIPMDSDNDGINDCDDVEPFSITTLVDENGRALDTDGDGVPDAFDEDNNTPAGVLVDARGNEVKVGGACCDCDNVTLPTVIFDNSSSKIAPSSFGVLYTIAEKLKQCPSLSLNATGYTASKSGEQLAWKRSNAIIDHLEANYGIERSRVSTVYSSGKGIDFSTRRIDLIQAAK